MTEMLPDRRADATLFGFDFQVNAAIVLVIENIKNLVSVRLEGNFEDIDLKLNDNRYILAQAKAIQRASDDFANVKTNLKKSLLSLSEAAIRVERGKGIVDKVVFITNSINPFKEKYPRFFMPTIREYADLTAEQKSSIDKYLDSIKTSGTEPLDKAKLRVQILPFETDNDAERYKFVKESINDFVGSLDIERYGFSNKLMEQWQNVVFKSGVKKKTDIDVSKKKIIWPLIVLLIDTDTRDLNIVNEFDEAVYAEAKEKYHDLIDSQTEHFDFVTRVLSEYYSFRLSHNKGSQRELCALFTNSNWMKYADIYSNISMDSEVKEAVIKITINRILLNHFSIDRIKQQVQL